jgi:Undecaprenyl-phosphate glucose phosphotransferase
VGSANAAEVSGVTIKSGKIDGARAGDGARLAFNSRTLGVLAFAVELVVIFGASVLTGVGYHLVVYNSPGPVEFFFGVGAIAALIYMLPFLMTDHERIQDFLEGRRNAGRGFLVWNYTFLCLSMLAFVTKTTDEFSRGWVVLFYCVGLGSVLGFEAAFRRLLGAMLASGRITFRRIMLVGASDEIRRFTGDREIARSGSIVVGTLALPRSGSIEEERNGESLLSAAILKARALRVDDVVVLTDWSRVDLMERIVEAFSSLPVEIHLGASSLVGRFSEARISKLASLTTLSLTAPALGPLQSMIKRSVDAIGSAIALVLLAPFFAGIALLIKLDSPGPVFFRQRRSGFNQQEFRIWKFRTMSTLDDGDQIVQARPADARVTRVGNYLRRFNIDELPQLINVLKGEMSLVGPRPHAVAHDRHYGEMIATYSRRLNVLPGITGWAQVNGSRGPTLTEASMRERVAYDLYYIENWSVAFDLYILALTLLSPKAFRNAH